MNVSSNIRRVGGRGMDGGRSCVRVPTPDVGRVIGRSVGLSCSSGRLGQGVL